MGEENQRRDEELVEAFRNGQDPACVDILLRRHLPKVRNSMFQMVGNHADADDLTQEVFIRVLNGLTSFQGKARFSTWLYRVAMNTAYTFLRKRERRRCESADLVPEPRTPACRRPDRAICLAELDGQVTEAVTALSPKLRAALVLVVLQQLPVHEAARIEQCTSATIYWRIHQARKRLKRQFREYLEP